MTLVRTSILNAMAVGIKMAVALVVNKVIAVYVGPAGYAILGQLQNAISILVGLAGGLFASGVTKITAQNFDSEATQQALWKTALRASICLSAVFSVGLLLARAKVSALLQIDSAMSRIFIVMACMMPLMAINAVLLAIINGKKDVSAYVLANIAGSVIALALVGSLTYAFGLYGALVATVVSPAAASFATLTLIVRKSWFRWSLLWESGSKQALRSLSGFALMGVISLVATPVCLMFVRDCISERVGLAAAGYWQASWKISEIYLMLVTTTLGIYYLPRVAEIRSGSELRREIMKVYRFAMPVVTVLAIGIYLCRDFIVRILFAPDFYPVRELFGWQLAGDVAKIGSWVLAFVMIGRGMVKAFIVTEMVFSLSFYLFSVFFVGKYGAVGAAMAYLLNYCIYWLLMVRLIGHESGRMEKFPELRS